jgi:tRNA pseudouridine55 synthase
MDGVLLIDKPAGLTSHEVVLQIRKFLGVKKIGHTGTLDPYATGVLVLCVGKATRIIEFLVRSIKEYQTTLKLGVTTDTQDFTGHILSEKPISVPEKELREQIQNFLGEIEQIPPMFSAIKIKGQRLYGLARQGQEVDRSPRKVTIYDFRILDIQFPFVSLQITCSHGTYIRTLVSDLGDRLGSGACVWELRRTRSGSFEIEDTITLEKLKSLSPEQIVEKYLIALDKALITMPALYFDEKSSKLLSQGAWVIAPSCQPLSAQGYYRGYDETGRFFAIIELIRGSENEKRAHPVKVIYTP